MEASQKQVTLTVDIPQETWELLEQWRAQTKSSLPELISAALTLLKYSMESDQNTRLFLKDAEGKETQLRSSA